MRRNNLSNKLLSMLLIIPVILIAGCSSGSNQNKYSKKIKPTSPFASGRSSQRSVVISVKAEHAVSGDVSTFIQASTTLEAERNVDVFSKVTAIAKNVLFEEGDHVHKRQLLIKLDDEEILNNYKQAKLAVDQAEVALKQAQVRKEQAEVTYKRNKQLLDEKLVSVQEYENSKLDNDYAALTLKNARYDLKVARERLAAAKINLENTEIKSPIDGIISERLVEVGDMVKANDKVCSIVDTDPLLARVYVPEVDMKQIKVGQQARVEAESVPDEKFFGKVVLLSPVIDPETGTGKVTVAIHDTSSKLKPGMFVNVYLTTSVHRNVVKILRKAVWHEKEEDWVYVVGPDSKVEKRKVKLGYIEDPWVEIVNGVKPGETVVTVGQDSLDNGYQVQIMEYESPGENVKVPSKLVKKAKNRPGAVSSSRRMQFMQLMANPRAREEMMKMRSEHPETFRYPEKRKEFFKKLLKKYGKK